MIYLLLVLLLFGLFQSLLELKKDNTKKPKWRVEKILSLIYIGIFFTGFIVILLQEKEANKANNIISEISSTITKINSISVEQLKSLSKSVKQTQLLINKSDSINKSIMLVLEFKESLITQYESVNDKLSKQLDLEIKQLKERAPNIGLLDYDISLDSSDTTSYRVSACIRNFGKRNALIIGGNGFILFFDKKNQPIHYVEIRGSNYAGLLEPNEISNMRLCYYSFGLKNLKELKQIADIAVICLKVHYEDIAMSKDSIQYFYSGWILNSNEFGGLRDWQLNLAKNWAIKEFST